MIPGVMPCYPTTSVAETEGGGIHHPSQLYHDVMEASFGGGATGSETQLRSLLCSLSVLKQKVDEVESLVSIILTQEIPHHHQGPTGVPYASVGTMIQELVMTASSMMFNCQQMSLGSSQTGNSETHNNSQGFLDGESFYNWYNNDNGTTTCSNNYISTAAARPDSSSRTTAATTTTTTMATAAGGMMTSRGRMVMTSNRKISRESRKSLLTEAYDLVEPDAEDLLAKYTHYCQICGKGFKRDANLRMHMRAHGDEYKTSEALSNPLKKEAEDQKNSGGAMNTPPRKYSCPQQGCRWNKNHAKFQPLKSIICVKNHYKRSHCPKMYVCKRCNRKQFSVLSDLRTHEKHCGDRKWQCSCGTTFSRKDKLMGHVALFVGHYPVVVPHNENKLEFHGELQIQFEDR